MTQDEHHRLGNDPFHDGSNVPDLLRMRGVGASTCGHVAELLPRIHRSDILEAIGLEDPDGAEFVDGDIADAAAAAMAIADLRGRSRRVIVARAAAIELCRAHLSTAEIADRLGIDRRTVQRLSLRAPNQGLVRAIAQQLTMRTRHRAALALAVPDDSLASPGAPLAQDAGRDARRNSGR